MHHRSPATWEKKSSKVKEFFCLCFFVWCSLIFSRTLQVFILLSCLYCQFSDKITLSRTMNKNAKHICTHTSFTINKKISLPSFLFLLLLLTLCVGSHLTTFNVSCWFVSFRFVSFRQNITQPDCLAPPQ